MAPLGSQANGLREFAFGSFDAAASAMAYEIARELRQRVRGAGRGSLAVGGGRTPKHVLPLLAEYDCSWDRITVSLTDERLVPPDDPQSNEALVRRYLIRGHATNAQVLPMVPGALDDIPAPDIVYLGFGEDGHVASLFPGGEELSASHCGQVMARAPVPPIERVSMTMPALLGARKVFILVSGATKRHVYDRAKSGGTGSAVPLARVLRQRSTAVHVFIDSAVS